MELLSPCVNNQTDRKILKMLLGIWNCSERPGRMPKHAEMAEELQISRQTVTRRIKNMKKKFMEIGVYDLIQKRIECDPTEEPEEEWKKKYCRI